MGRRRQKAVDKADKAHGGMDKTARRNGKKVIMPWESYKKKMENNGR